MTKQQKIGAISPDDVVAVSNPHGTGRVVLVCEHASNMVPAKFNDLGLSPAALQSHIAWDMGALAVAEALSARLDAPLIAHRVSRLVFDCNRSPDALDAIPDLSEYNIVPGNVGLTPADRADRAAHYYTPFCDALSTCLEQRVAACPPDADLPVLITIHSFTPIYKEDRRAVEIGILHEKDARLANEILRCAGEDGKFSALRNVPYGPDDGVTFTLERHAVARGLLNVMIEIRNDLITDAAGQQAMAETLSHYITSALSTISSTQDIAKPCEAKTMPKAITHYVRYVDAVNRVVGRGAMYMIFLMVGVLFYSSIMKTFFLPVQWTLEMAQFLMATYYLLGGGYSMQLGSHVRMDLLYGTWKPRQMGFADSLTSFCLIFYLVILWYGGFSSTEYALTYGEKSYSSWSPYMAPVKLIMLFGISLMVLQATAFFFRDLAKARGVTLEGEPLPDVAPDGETLT